MGVAFCVAFVADIVGESVASVAGFNSLRGEPIRLRETLRRAVECFFPLLFLSILSGLLIGVGMIVLFIPGILLSVRGWVLFRPASSNGWGPWRVWRAVQN